MHNQHDRDTHKPGAFGDTPRGKRASLKGMHHGMQMGPSGFGLSHGMHADADGDNSHEYGHGMSMSSGQGASIRMGGGTRKKRASTASTSSGGGSSTSSSTSTSSSGSTPKYGQITDPGF